MDGIDLIVSVALWVIFAIAVASFAERRGHRREKWFIISLLVSPLLALLFIVMNGPSTETGSTFKKCPFCFEAIRSEAIRCRHCQADLQVVRRTVGP
jgi:uncharacterized membrane protein